MMIRESVFSLSLKDCLPLLSRHRPRQEYLTDAVRLIAGWSGCRCVGIRLVDCAGKMPYEAYIGFSREFWEKEKELFLEDDCCACTRVCTGRTISSDVSAVSSGGSFVTGDLAAFAATLGEEDRARYRGACISEGFASVAVIPLRHGDRTLGMIHLADTAPHLVTADRLEALEAVAAVIAEVMNFYRVEEDLRSSEATLRGVLDAAQESIWLFSPTGEVLLGNATALQSRGVGQNVDEVPVPGLSTAQFARLRRAVETARPVFFEEVRGDVSLAHSFYPVVGSNGAVTAVACYSRDVTLQKQEQENTKQAHARVEKLVEERTADLREKTALLKTILETLPVGVALIDAAGSLEYVNQSMVAIWDGVKYVDRDGYDEYRIFRHGTNEVLAPSEYPAARALRSGQSDSANIFDILSFAGNRKTVAISSAPICFEGRERNGIVVVIEDMTKQQELQKQLHHSQKLESVGALAGGIAHDFNNILMAICGYAGHVYEELEDEELRASMRQVLRGSERARELTQKLLAFSRQQVTETEVTSVTRIVATATAFLSRILGEDIEVVQELSHLPLNVRGNPGQIEQVVMNVMVNARDAMPGGGKLVVATGKMSWREVSALHLGARIEVPHGFIRISDTGIGIPEQHLERIFEPYFSTKETGKGTGLGLAIAYGLVRQHDGVIAVSSIEGEGTTFTILLPLTGEAASEQESPAPAEAPKGVETVLVVEDDDTIRTYLRFVLKKSGYNVVTAENGEEAVRIMPEHDVDVVLSDVIMPKMNGMEMYREMKKSRPDLKVIFASGYSSDILNSKGIDSEPLRFLQKPVMKDALLKMLREVLDSSDDVTTADGYVGSRAESR